MSKNSEWYCGLEDWVGMLFMTIMFGTLAGLAVYFRNSISHWILPILLICCAVMVAGAFIAVTLFNVRVMIRRYIIKVVEEDIKSDEDVVGSTLDK